MRTAAAITVTAALAAGLGWRFARALGPEVARQRVGPCRALDPEPVGGPARPFALPDPDGRERTLAAQRGRAVLLNFWATWCPPCLDELPSIEALGRRLRGRPFALVAVSADESWDPVRDLFARRGTTLSGDRAPLTVLLDPSRKVARAYGTEKLPETYLIAPDGTVRYRFVNTRDWSSPEAVACVESVLP